MKVSKTDQDSQQWQKTPVANLVRNAASGGYYARVRIAGKLIWKSLKTDRMTVAQLRLGDFPKQERHRAEAVQATARGKMTFEQALNRSGISRRYLRRKRSVRYSCICALRVRAAPLRLIARLTTPNQSLFILLRSK